MAKEHLNSFGPEDVVRVVLRCESCSGELSFPVGREPRVLDHCPTCLAEWDRSDQYRGRQSQMKQLAGALRYFSNRSTREEMANGLSWTVRLVIEDRPGDAVQDAL